MLLCAPQLLDHGRHLTQLQMQSLHEAQVQLGPAEHKIDVAIGHLDHSRAAPTTGLPSSPPSVSGAVHAHPDAVTEQSAWWTRPRTLELCTITAV